MPGLLRCLQGVQEAGGDPILQSLSLILAYTAPIALKVTIFESRQELRMDVLLVFPHLVTEWSCIL